MDIVSAIGFKCLVVIVAASFVQERTTVPMAEVGKEEARVVYPAGLAIGESAARILSVFTGQSPLRGIPARSFNQGVITIALATDPLPSGSEAWSSARASLIVLPIAATEWTEKRLSRALRHEWSHIVLGRTLGFRETPMWFSEGLAEWVAGGLTCEGKVRIALDLRLRSAGGAEAPLLNVGVLRPNRSLHDQSSRVEYDYSASFFEYLAARDEALLEGHALLIAVNDRGVVPAVEHLVGAQLSEVIEQWQLHLKREYGDWEKILVESACAQTAEYARR